MQREHELTVMLAFEKPVTREEARDWLLAAIAKGNGKRMGPAVKPAREKADA